MSTVNTQSRMITDIKVGCFIGFIILCALMYVMFWSPHVKAMNTEVIRTKAMVSIIPFDIIRQVAEIQKFILDNVIFANS